MSIQIEPKHPIESQVEPLLTIEDLDAMPEDGNRYELIEGDLFVSRAPSLKHQLIGGNLYDAIRGYLKQHPLGLVISTPGVIFSQYSGVIPDLVYISNERRAEIATGDKIKGAPDIAIEILSPGKENVDRDRKVKLYLYRKYGVKEYWIADPEARSIEVYAGSGLKLAKRLTIEDTLTSELLPGFECAVKEAFSF